jgi:hypothetical protein
MHIPHISSKQASKQSSKQVGPSSLNAIPASQPSQPLYSQKGNAQPCNACNIIHKSVPSSKNAKNGGIEVENQQPR